MTNTNRRVRYGPVLSRRHHFRGNIRRLQRLHHQAAPREEGRRRQRNALACGRCRQRKIKCENEDGSGCQACRNAGQAKCNYRRVQSEDIDPRAYLEIIGVPPQVNSREIHEIESFSPTSTVSPNHWNPALGATSDRSASMIPMRSDPSQYSMSTAGQSAQFSPNTLLYSNDQAQYSSLEGAECGQGRLSSRLMHNSRGSIDQAGNAGFPQLASTRNSSLTGSPLSSQVSESSCFTSDSNSAMSEGLTAWPPQPPYTSYSSDSTTYYSGMSPAVRHLPQPSSTSSFGPRNSMSALDGIPRHQDQFLYDETYDLGRMLPEGGHHSADAVTQRNPNTPFSPEIHRNSIHSTAVQSEAVTRASRAGTYLAPARESQQTYGLDNSINAPSTYLTTSSQAVPHTRFPNAALGWEFWNPRNTPINEGPDGGRVTHRQGHRQFKNIQARPRRPESSEGNPN